MSISKKLMAAAIVAVSFGGASAVDAAPPDLQTETRRPSSGSQLCVGDFMCDWLKRVCDDSGGVYIDYPGPPRRAICSWH